MARAQAAEGPRDRHRKAGSGRAIAPDRARLKYLRGRLEIYERAYRAGVHLALYEALALCRIESSSPEGWMLDAMLEFMEEHIGRVPQGRGRTGNRLARIRQDLVHYARWDAVKEVRDYQEAQRRALDKLKDLDLSEADRRHVAGQIRSFGATFEEALDHASKLLKGTPAGGSRETMRASYWKVHRAMRKPQQVGGFLVLQPATRRRFGLIV